MTKRNVLIELILRLANANVLISGMRERRDLRTLDQEDDTDKLFKPPSRRRVYELKAMVDSATSDQGMAACSNHENRECDHGYWCGSNSFPFKSCGHSLTNNGNAEEKYVVCAADTELVVHEECCSKDSVDVLHESNIRRSTENDDVSASCDPDSGMHDPSSILPCSAISDKRNEKLCTSLQNITLASDINSEDITVKEIRSDVVQSVSIEIPCKKSVDEDRGAVCTSFVLYFTENDWCRPLESPPDEEEQQYGAGAYASGGYTEEEKKEKEKKGGSKSSSKSHSNHKHESHGQRHETGSEPGSSSGGQSGTRASARSSSGAERQRVGSPHSRVLGRQLSIIPEGGQSDGENAPTDRKDAIQSKPKVASGNVGHFQGNVATAVVQGTRDENQNRTWKSVQLGNLDKMEGSHGKDGGSPTDKDAAKVSHHTQVRFQFFRTE